MRELVSLQRLSLSSSSVTTSDGILAGISRWSVGILLDLVDPPAARLSGRTFALMTEHQVDVAFECCVGWHCFTQPGNVAEDGISSVGDCTTQCIW